MKNAMIGSVVLVLLLLFAELVFGTVEYRDEFRCVAKGRRITVVTGRDKPEAEFAHLGTFSSLAGLWSWEVSDVARLELAPDGFDAVEIGDVLSYDELVQLRGRSLIGRAWDFAKSNR